MLPINRIPDKNRTVYATAGDFCRVFQKQMSSLYLLAFLLTADQEKAEACYVAGLGDCWAGNPVFKEWASSWARRSIVRNAIAMMKPEPEQRRYVPNAFHAETNEIRGMTSEVSLSLPAVLRLSAFDRFAFVMAVLEKYSDRDCSLLLACSWRDVISARARAWEQLANMDAMRAIAIEPRANLASA